MHVQQHFRTMSVSIVQIQSPGLECYANHTIIQSSHAIKCFAPDPVGELTVLPRPSSCTAYQRGGRERRGGKEGREGRSVARGRAGGAAAPSETIFLNLGPFHSLFIPNVRNLFIPNVRTTQEAALTLSLNLVQSLHNQIMQRIIYFTQGRINPSVGPGAVITFQRPLDNYRFITHMRGLCGPSKLRVRC